MKKVLLLEPDPRLSDRLYQIILQCNRNVSIFQTADVAKAYQLAVAYDIELMLVDIRADKKAPGDMAGLRFVSDIRGIERYAFVPIIVLASFMDDSLPVFWELHCYGYLDKSFSDESAEHMIRDALRYQMPKKGQRYIYFKDGCLVYSFRISEIVYIEHKRRKTRLHTTEGIVSVPYQTCGETMEQLMDYGFVICSRGTLVNLEFVRAVDGLNQYLILKKDFGRLPIGRNYIRKIKDILQQM